MPDNRSNRGGRDRSRVAGGQGMSWAISRESTRDRRRLRSIPGGPKD
jgi:hypothetical protein